MNSRLIIIFMLTIITNVFSCNVKMSDCYNIILNKTLIANLEISNKEHTNTHTIFFYAIDNKNQESSNKYDFWESSEKASSSIILNLLQRNKLPSEHEILNVIRSLIPKYTNNNVFQIEILFYKNRQQDYVLYKLLGFTFTFYLTNNKTNFLLFSGEGEPPLLKIKEINNSNNIDECPYIKHGKITMLNIANKASRNKKTEINVGNSQFFVSYDDSSVSTSTLQYKHNSSFKKRFFKRETITENSKKILDCSINENDQYNMRDILNMYSNSEIEDIMFLLSPKYLDLLSNIYVSHKESFDKKYYHYRENIFLINPYFPIFSASATETPQLLLSNIYTLGVTSEIIKLNNNKEKFIFHFYNIFNYADNMIDNDTLHTEDFLTVYTNENDIIYKIIIHENENEIIFQIT